MPAWAAFEADPYRARNPGAPPKARLRHCLNGIPGRDRRLLRNRIRDAPLTGIKNELDAGVFSETVAATLQLQVEDPEIAKLKPVKL